MHKPVLAISDFPGVKKLLVSALWQKAAGGTRLPDTKLSAKVEHIDESLLTRYNQLLGWPDEKYLHPAFLHVLAMPLHLSLLLEKNFPFSVKGLIHIRNQISQSSWIKKEQPLTLSCYFAEVEIHPRGWLFSVITEAHSDTGMVWKEQSSFLSRCKHPNPMDKVDDFHAPKSMALVSHLHFQKDCGREYAACSGDYNPIHLWPWSAKLFGFARPIAHGMYTLAKCLTMLLKQKQTNSGQLEVDVLFKRPLLLPGNAQLIADNNSNQFSLEHKDEVFVSGCLHRGKTEV